MSRLWKGGGTRGGRGRGRGTGERQGPSSSSLIRCLRAVKRTSLTKGETSFTLQLLTFIFQSFGYFNASSAPSFSVFPSFLPFLLPSFPSPARTRAPSPSLFLLETFLRFLHVIPAVAERPVVAGAVSVALSLLYDIHN